MYKYCIFFIHSSVHEHLGCFPLLAIVSSAPVNIEVHVSCWITVLSRYICSGVGLQDHMVILLLVYWVCPYCFSLWVQQLAFPPEVEDGSHLSTPSPAFVIYRLLMVAILTGPLQYSCLENPMGGGAWWAAVHGVSKSWTRLSNFTLTFHFHALEKDMATHSSMLAWRVPGTGEPGGLPSMGSHRVGHDWSNLAAAAFWLVWGDT